MSFTQYLQPGLGLILLLIVLFIVYKVVKAGLNLLIKIILIPIVLFVAPSLWFVMGNNINSFFTKKFPDNQNLKCIGLDEDKCKEKSECEVVKFGSSGVLKLIPPMCTRK